jgi:hypothetical protein
MTQAETRFALPPLVSPAEWQAAHEKLLAKEKEATHARDALAAERVHSRRRKGPSHVLHFAARASRRSAACGVSGSHAARSAGDVGSVASRPAAECAVPVVAPA